VEAAKARSGVVDDVAARLDVGPRGVHVVLLVAATTTTTILSREIGGFRHNSA